MYKQAVALAKEGRGFEVNNPSQAVKKYLEAAQLLLSLAKKDRNKENEYVNEASVLYMRASSLRKHNSKPKIKILNNNVSIKTDIGFDSIGGLQDVKKQLQLKIIQPFLRPDIFEKFNKKPGGGVLLYGPPGCGKTMIAKAVANEANLPFFHVKPSDFKSKYVGETEQNISNFFEKVRQSQPCVVFFDEFESLGRERSSANDIESGFVSQLLTEIDGFDSKDNKILLLAATNEPWLVDNAFKRSGRFGLKVFVPPADFDARKTIFDIHLENVDKDGIDTYLLADLTDGLTGADIKHLVDKATDIVISDCLDGTDRVLMVKDFAAVIKNLQSTATPWLNKAMKFIEKNNAYDEYSDVVDYLKD